MKSRAVSVAFVLCVAGLLPPGNVAADGQVRQRSSGTQPTELPVQRIAHPGSAAEAYFSPEGRSLICNAKLPGDASYHVYTMSLDGTGLRRINDRGEDACSYYFPDGKRLIWTSTRDRPDLPKGNWSKPLEYPQGAELYTSAPDGSEVRRLTRNDCYDAEVSVSPDGRWVLFTRQTDGRLDLWKMRPDGSGEFQITKTPDWQEGGSFFMPDGETIVFRAWKMEVQAMRGKPMAIFTVKHDGTGRRRITHDGGTNWAPYPAPDGKHVVFAKMLPPHNFEVFLLNLETGEPTRLTYNDAFDAYPAISPDGKMVVFSSSRGAAPDERKLFLYKMDISSLSVGRRE